MEVSFQHSYEALEPLQAAFQHAYAADDQGFCRFRHAYVARQWLPKIQFKHAYTTIQLLPNTRFLHSYSTGDGVRRFLHAYTVANDLLKRFPHAYTALPNLIEIPPSPGSSDPPTYMSEWDLATLHNQGELQCTFKVVYANGDVMDLLDVPYQFVVNQNLSAPATASMNIIDPDGRYHPETENSEWFDVMDEAPIGADNQETKELQATCHWGGLDFVYHMLGVGYSSGRNSKERVFDFNWKLIDHCQKLQADFTTLPSIRSGRNGIITNVAAMKDMLDMFKVAHDFSNYTTPEYPIPVMHRQSGRPYDFLLQILQTTLDEHIFASGNVFTPFYPDQENPQFVVDMTDPNVQEESNDASLQDIYNHVIVVRAAETNGQTQSTVDLNDFGQYTVQFSEKLAGVTWTMAPGSSGGLPSDFLIKGEDGAVYAVRDGRAPSTASYGATFSTGGPLMGVKSITFTWGALPNQLAAGSPGQIVFTGTPYPDSEGWGGEMFPTTIGTAEDPLPDFRSEARDDESIAKFGYRRLEIQANPGIPTKAIGDLLAARILAKSARRSRTGAYRLHLNPRIVPGVVILEKDPPRGIIRKRIVTSVEHAYSKMVAYRYTKYSGIVNRSL